MPDFAQRSFQKELLDEDNIPFEALQQNLRELEFINVWLGGHAVTVAGLSQLMKDRTMTYTLLDVGSGGGDTLRFIARWAKRKGLKVRLIGLDYKQEAIDYARVQSSAYPTIEFVLSDYRDLDQLPVRPDILISSLFCHHLDDDQMMEYVGLIARNARLGFVINDLHRHRLAYYSIKWLAALFSRSYLLKNDAPLSVWRGFSKKDLEGYFRQAALQGVQTTWKWAFRWLVVGRNHPVR